MAVGTTLGIPMSTDGTLGGVSPSTVIVPTQSAVKTYVDTEIGALGIQAYAPAYGVSTAPSGYQWAGDGARLELAPCTSSFPAVNLLTTDLPGSCRRNSSYWVAATPSGGTLALQVANNSVDFNSTNHGSATILDRTAPNGSRDMTLTMHVSGSIVATHINGVGIGIWDGTSNNRTARIAVYYLSGQIVIYYGYNTTETYAVISAANLTTGVWLQIGLTAAGTLTLKYQVAATATTAPTGGWTTGYTATEYTWNTKWAHICYSIHGFNLSGATRTLPSITFFDDTTMAGCSWRRSPLDGAGLGVSASSPAVTLFTDVAYDSSVCDQTALRAWAAKVASLAYGETASVEFLVRSASTLGGYVGSTWQAASAITAPSSSTYLEVQARVMSNGAQCGSLYVAAVNALRVL